jgi:O-antigen/teichoic acid export membrane protein
LSWGFASYFIEAGLLADSQITERGRSGAAANAVISLAGAVGPALVALVAIPGLVHALGAELFGVLSFVWIVFGTFAVLDFGTGRATTKYVAELIAGERVAAIGGLFWSAAAINLTVGMVCGIVLFVTAPWLSAHVVNVQDALQPSAVRALRITAFALPWIVLGGVFRSALEGLQRFDLSNAVQLPAGALNYLAPLFVARAGGTLPWVVAAVCVTRVLAVPPLFLLCRRQLPMLGRPRVEREQLGRLVRFGSWLTVSNVVGPLLLSLDRLLVGSIEGARALGLYAPVYELVTRLSIIPGSVMAALFPAFSTLTHDAAATIHVAMRRAQRLLALLMLPVLLVGVCGAPIILRLWLGPAQTSQSTVAMQLLCIGLVALSVGAVPFTLVQAVGRPKWSAIVHLVELPIHAAVTWWMVTRFGVVGAAAAWSVRALFDALLFDAAVSRMLGREVRPVSQASTRVTAAMTVLASILSLFATWMNARPTVLAILGLIALAVYGIVAWQWSLEPVERERARRVVGRVLLLGRSRPVRDTAPKPAPDQGTAG